MKSINTSIRDNKAIVISALLSFLSFLSIAQNQTNISVSSLAEMMQYFDDDNVNVTLTTGTYDIGLGDADDDNGDDGLDLEPTFFWITGTNSTFDFQNSTITIDTRLFAHYVNYGKYGYGNSPSVDEFHITGTNITVKNLTVDDIGWSAPQRSATGWKIDGQNNTLDNITHYTRGSYPYGFGDAFGKGGPYQTGLRPLKHGCMVVGGLDITIKNCNIYQYSYGHAIQLIACQNVTIDGCYVEGQMKSTDDMYDGIGIAETEYDAAVAANFITTWNGDFQLPRGYYMSLAEDGIRTYNTDGWWVGGSIRDGGYKTSDIANTDENRRNTQNIYVTNSEVRGMRTAFTLYQGGEDKVIDNCRAYDNEVGFVTARSRSITNCYGNAKYGPVFSVVYGEEKIVVDITIDDNSAVDGQYQMAYVSGWNHNITLKSSVTPNPNQEITVGGRKYGPRNIEASNGSDSYLDNAYNGVYNNQSGYPIVLSSGAATYNTGTSNATVTNNYVDNNNINVNIEEVCENSASLLEAECFDNMSGVQAENSSEGGRNIGYINDGDWIMYEDINLTNRASVNIRVASAFEGGTIDIRLGSTTGQLIGSLEVDNTGGNQLWETISTTIDSVSGTRDVYFVFSGGNGYLFNINWIELIESNTPIAASFTPDPNKTYYIDSPYHNLRLAADGESEDPYTTSISDTGENVQWQFVNAGNNTWYLDRAAGGSTSRLRTDTTEFADMQSDSHAGIWEAFTITEGYIEDTYYLTLFSAPENANRLQINNSSEVKMVTTNHAQTWESFTITEAGSGIASANFSLIEAENYDAMSGVQTEVSTENGENVGWINNNDWLLFEDIDLTGAQSVDMRISSNFIGGSIEIRTGSTTGTLLGSVSISNTGGNQNWQTLNTSINNASGTQDVYLVFKGGNGYLFNINWLEFSSSSTSGKAITEIALNNDNIVIYPNPIQSIATISGANNSTLRVYDMNGKILLEKNIKTADEQINLNHLSTGVYYAQIFGADKRFVIKIVKQ